MPLGTSEAELWTTPFRVQIGCTVVSDISGYILNGGSDCNFMSSFEPTHLTTGIDRIYLQYLNYRKGLTPLCELYQSACTACALYHLYFQRSTSYFHGYYTPVRLSCRRDVLSHCFCALIGAGGFSAHCILLAELSKTCYAARLGVI